MLKFFLLDSCEHAKTTLKYCQGISLKHKFVQSYAVDCRMSISNTRIFSYLIFFEMVSKMDTKKIGTYSRIVEKWIVIKLLQIQQKTNICWLSLCPKICTRTLKKIVCTELWSLQWAIIRRILHIIVVRKRRWKMSIFISRLQESAKICLIPPHIICLRVSYNQDYCIHFV